MKENNTSNIQKSIWIELWACIKNGNSRLVYPNFPFCSFLFKFFSVCIRHHKWVVSLNGHQTHNRGNRHICENVSFPVLHQ